MHAATPKIPSILSSYTSASNNKYNTHPVCATVATTATGGRTPSQIESAAYASGSDCVRASPYQWKPKLGVAWVCSYCRLYCVVASVESDRSTSVMSFTFDTVAGSLRLTMLRSTLSSTLSTAALTPATSSSNRATIRSI